MHISYAHECTCKKKLNSYALLLLSMCKFRFNVVGQLLSDWVLSISNWNFQPNAFQGTLPNEGLLHVSLHVKFCKF